MLYIILLILKIVGIVLLLIIALLLLLLCVFLFVPIRYRIKSDNESGIQASGSVTWFLHLVHLHIIYMDDFSYFLTVFGMKIYPKKNKKKFKDKQKKKSKAKVNKKNEEKNTKKLNHEVVQIEAHKKEKTNKKRRKGKKDKKKIKFTFSSVYDRIKKNLALFKKNIHRIKDEKTKRAFLLCKKELVHIFKLITPRNINGLIELGMKDPSQTGELYGLYSALFLVHKGKIVMIPYFEEEIFSYKVTAIGRIRLITLLIIAIKLYFSKDIQRLIHIFKKEED